MADKKLTKLNVIAAVEPTDGINPSSVLDAARQMPEKMVRRVTIADYLPAFKTLLKKGYTQAESAEMLVALGCPFKPTAITVRYREMKRGAGK